MPDQDPPVPPVPPTTPTTPTDNPPGAVVTIEDVRVGSGGTKQENPTNPDSAPSGDEGGTESSGSRSIKVTVQLPPV